MLRLLALTLVAASAASAQTVPFRPLAVGNSWAYILRAVSTPTPTCSLPAEPTGSVVLSVVRDTTLSGAEARVVRCLELDAFARFVSLSETVVTAAFGPVHMGESACTPLLTGTAPNGSPPGAYPVDIGGRETVMNALAFYVFSANGSGATFGRTEELYGDRVGLYERQREYSRGLPPASCSKTAATLLAATVDGETFGVVVAGEDGPAAERTLRAYPTPARTRVTVEAGAASAVEVSDALGRRVATGDAAPGQPLLLDVSAWPPGVYLARTVGGPLQTVRIVVAR